MVLCSRTNNICGFGNNHKAVVVSIGIKLCKQKYIFLSALKIGQCYGFSIVRASYCSNQYYELNSICIINYNRFVSPACIHVWLMYMFAMHDRIVYEFTMLSLEIHLHSHTLGRNIPHSVQTYYRNGPGTLQLSFDAAHPDNKYQTDIASQANT